MKKPSSNNPPMLNRDEETAIQAIADKMTEQIRQLLAASLSEILFLLKENRREPNVQQTPQPNQFLTAIEMAEILKISKAQSYQLIRTKVIPSFCIGKTVRVRTADLNAFIEAHMVR